MSAQLHDADFYTWTQQQADHLWAGRLDALDALHLIEELESMGARERRELETRLSILLQHLLKWRYQPERRGSSWRNTIKVQRIDAGRVLADNPGLTPKLPELFEAAYERARLLAAADTGKEESDFPEHPPLTFDQAMSPDYWPEDQNPESVNPEPARRA